jgi:hypothetical protein
MSTKKPYGGTAVAFDKTAVEFGDRSRHLGSNAF